MDRLRVRLLHWVTEWDTKQSKKEHYNRYALPIMFGSIQDNFDPAIADGATCANALKRAFCYPSQGLTFIARGLSKDGLLSDEQLADCLPKKRWED